MLKLKMFVAIALLFVIALPGRAAQTRESKKEPIYTITINVVDRTTNAINYQHRNGATKIDFRGTPLLPASHGEAKVESKQGYMEIEVEFRNLQSATRFGPEFLTYVMWAITPEGRAMNMGEVILNGTSSKLDVTTELQTFGLVVTAEPYFGVTQPSDVVVMENFVRADTIGKVVEIEAKYELLQRGHYTVNVLPADLKPMVQDEKTPLDLYEARNAVRIARWAGAEVSAGDSYQKASNLLAQAEKQNTSKAGTKAIATTAREAVQTAEDARLITLKNQATDRQAKERQDSADREAATLAASARHESEANAASAAREAEARQASMLREANANTVAANARADASDAERARATAQAQTDRVRLEAQAAANRAAAEATAQAERTRMDAELAAQRTARDKESAEVANQLAKANAAAQAEHDKQELRSKLSVQLNAILQTQDTARGLIVDMSDVLFDSGQFSLKPGAREKLAKISGIVLLYPSLKLEVEGHTDSVGADSLNMTLSENRANSVRDFLVAQGIAGSSISSTGFGKGHPVATNDTAAGRQQNRRVELVVSGEVIGSKVTSQAKQ